MATDVRAPRIQRVQPVERGIEVDLGGPRLALTVLGPRLLRVRWSPGGEWRPRRRWAVTTPDEAFPATDHEVEEIDGGARVRTPEITASVFADGSLAVTSAGGHELAREVAPRSWDQEAGRSTWTLQMPEERRYFGFGERTGLLEKRGRRYTCWTTDEWRSQAPTTDALYVAVPFHLALDPDGTSHGIFLDTTFRSAFDLRRFQEGRLTLEAETAGLDWYLLFGPRPEGVVRLLGDLVGRAALPPRWALGYHQARWSYETADEVLQVAASLRGSRIPADAIHLDIDHMDRFRPFTWDAERFPAPASLTKTLRDQGFRATAVVDTALPIADDYAVYREARDRGFILRHGRNRDAPPIDGFVWGGRSVYPDHARGEVREWWGALHRPHLDEGIAGFLNDMNEPSMRDRRLEEEGAANIEPPPEAPAGDPELEATHAELRNLYGLQMDQATAAHLRATRPDERPFVVTRSGFAGLQRDAILWTGDNWSTWEHLEMSLPQLLNLGLSGVPIAGADIGGFFGDCTPELLVRWMQLGALYPFARSNSARDTARQEPWAWGEPTTSRCRRAIELRYRLLPYLYTVVEEASRTGLPVLRPLFLEHPDDPGSQAAGDVALLGRDLLVAPVVRPGADRRPVYLPPGEWVDMRNGQRHAGSQTILARASLDDGIPLFARAGSIIPMIPVVQSTGERAGRLELHIHPGTDGAATGRLYEDDGESMSYLDGDLARTAFRAVASEAGMVVSARRRGGFRPGSRTVELLVHEGAGAKPRRAQVDDADAWEVVVA